MASKSNAVWAIDIGNNSLKVLHLTATDGSVKVIGFDNIQYEKILSASGVTAAERDELIALSLRQFVRENNLGKEPVVVSVPSQNSFARFVNLPPVAAKRIPEIVKFEAAQQIPFDINDVQWDWQLMNPIKTGQNKVGIFAIKADVVNQALTHFSRENIIVACVQMTPMAIYNYILFDRAELLKNELEATVVLNIGAENTDLVVCSKDTVWQRCILMGGNAFTIAIADTFKLNFQKAEKLKRTAPLSKYARQIYQAMKPVFTDLASEIQRSIGFYNTSNPNTKINRVIALGGGTKMRGLTKYLQQTLQIPVERPDAFKKLQISSEVSAAKFHEAVCDFAVVYGLALQGLGLAKIESNLLPKSIARHMTLAGKAKYFTAAAVILMLVAVIGAARIYLDKVRYDKYERERAIIREIVETTMESANKLDEQANKGPVYEAIIQNEFEYFKHRDVVPRLLQTILLALPNETNNPEQAELYRAFDKRDVQTILKIPRKERKQIFITSLSVLFAKDIGAATFGQTGITAVSMPSPGYTPTPDINDQINQTAQGQVPEEGAGFMVAIEGYSPYKTLNELMDPIGVKDDKKKWGFITWLSHTDNIIDGNSPFKLYKKTKVEHFQYEEGEVGAEADKEKTGTAPDGIGIALEETKNIDSWAGEQVLMDPMTHEIISKVAELEKGGKNKIDNKGKVIYKVNDHWFKLNAKFLWKDAPKQAAAIEQTGTASQ